MKWKFLLPALLFAVLAGFLLIGLQRDPHHIPSPLIGKPAAPFEAPLLFVGPSAPDKFSSERMKGQVWLLNVWASWCVPCKQEHPVLMKLARDKKLPIVGLNYKDNPADAQAMLAKLGNPFEVVPVDPEGRISIHYGVYGVPETYLIDRQGIIRYKLVGPLLDDVLEKTVMPLIESLQKS